MVLLQWLHDKQELDFRMRESLLIIIIIIIII